MSPHKDAHGAVTSGPVRSADETRRAIALEQIFQTLRAGDVGRAKGLALDALSKGLEHPILLNLRALEHEEQGRFEQSLADLRRAHILAPRDFSILNACGLCLARMDRLEEAIQCFDQALEIEPGFGPAWFNRGWALEQTGETAKAAQAYEKAAELNPENPQAWANLAWLAARRNDAASARRHADRAFALQPGHPTATLALADVELAEPLVAERRLRGLLAEPDLAAYDRAVALGQLGDALDALDRPAEAFAAYDESNRVFRAEAAPRFEAAGQPTVADSLAWLVPWAQALDAGRWAAEPRDTDGGAGERAHVFLVGFPRSGTTLVESVLAGHPDVASLEEKNTLRAAVRDFMGDARAMSKLESMRDKDLQPYRDDYWRVVKESGGNPADKIFIDKNPFNTIKLPLIYKLFPYARIIFAVRDPRDVILSCFRRRFGLNPSTYELLDLKRAAAFYDRTMQFAQVLKQKQQMDEHPLVYERLVEDFTSEVAAACAFIGADWRAELLEFAARGQRGDVASASSAQIARGLYSDGAGQWRRYRTELAPVLETLAPWVRHFGYPAD